MLNEFKPALFFVGKFMLIYFVGNILYGLYVESYGDRADHLTTWVTEQTIVLLNNIGESTEAYANETEPKVHILDNERVVLSIYEGCNGLNVIVIFIAFVVAYGGRLKNIIWFSVSGIVVIHIMNLTRIVLLYFVAQYYPNFMYFTHKYLFTGFIYAVVLALWYWWATKWSK